MIRRRSLLFALPVLIAAPKVVRAWQVPPTPVPTTDPYYANTVLLMHMDQANGSLSPIDQKGHVMTSAATIPITTSQFKFGTGSANQTSITAGGISTPDSPDWDFGAGPFTVECFIRATQAPAAFRVFVGQWVTAGADRGWFFGFNGAALVFFYSTTGADNSFVGGNFAPTLNSWDYVAVTRDANNFMTVRANGALIGSGVANATIWNSTQTLVIGNDGTNGRAFAGQIDEVRITKGVARNISVVPTAPFFNS